MKIFQKRVYLRTVLIVLAILGIQRANAQDKPEFFATADVTSSYVWRGFQEPDSWGSLQPSVGVSWKSVSLSAWAMTTVKSGLKELDLNVAYEWNNFNLSLNDYYFFSDVSYVKHWWDAHSLEATLAYSFGESFPLTLSYSTFLLGNSDRRIDLVSDPLAIPPFREVYGKRYYSSYVQADYEFTLGEVEMTATLGLCPWTSPWMSDKEGIQVTNIGLKATYPFEWASFPIKAWAQCVYNPSVASYGTADKMQRGIYPVAGLSFEF